MMGKTWRNFLKMKEEEQLRYDFTDDCTDSEAHKERYEEKKGLEKFFIYRSLGIKRNNLDKEHPVTSVIDNNLKIYGDIKDPDLASELLQDIYSHLWIEIWKNKCEYMINRKGWIYSDTMTSAQTVLNDYINNVGKFEDARSKIKEEFGPKANASTITCVWLYKNDLQFQSLLGKDKNLVDFINAYHTIGNFIPVPYGFNSARSGAYASYDYWDLTLMKIKEYYDVSKSSSGNDVTNNESAQMKIIKELLHNSDSEDEIISCYRWLNSFKAWKDFIDINLLQDFVDENYQVKQLCTGHSWECPKVSDKTDKNETEEMKEKKFDEFFQNASNAIEARSNRMIAMIREKTFL